MNFFNASQMLYFADMNQVEHIGIAVKNLEASIAMYTLLLGVKPYKTEEVASEGVITVFFDAGNTKIELLSATRPDSPIAKFIEKRGEGIHHLAFGVDNIKKKIEEKKEAGFELINTEPKDGADNKLIAFLHPKSTGNILVEMCEEKK
jgi:methylmalonyl-CoA/ethylmalonyl-CoA epimerase